MGTRDAVVVLSIFAGACGQSLSANNINDGAFVEPDLGRPDAAVAEDLGTGPDLEPITLELDHVTRFWLPINSERLTGLARPAQPACLHPRQYPGRRGTEPGSPAH